MPAEFNPLETLARYADRITVRLYRNLLPPRPLLELADFQECSFPGYTPRAGVRWQGAMQSKERRAASASTDVLFGHTADSPLQQVVGVYFTARDSDQVETLLVHSGFPGRILLGGDVPWLYLNITMFVFELAAHEERRWLMLPTVVPLSVHSDLPRVIMSGEDRALFRNLQSTLEAAVSRDARIVEFTPRSQRSRVPFIPGDDAELRAAVELVRNRIAALLTAAS